MTIFKKRLMQGLALLCVWTGVSAPVLAKPYKGAEIFTSDAEMYGKYVIRMRAAKGSGVISNFFLCDVRRSQTRYLRGFGAKGRRAFAEMG